MPGSRFLPRDEIKARWAYGELLSPSKQAAYMEAGLADLATLARARMGFDELAPGDRQRLADAIAQVRGPGLAAAVDEHDGFRLEHWTAARLAQCFVVSQFDLPHRERHVPFYDFLLATEVPALSRLMAPDEPRVLAGMAPNLQLDGLEAAVAVYPFPNVLVDGYLRSILFFRHGTPDARFPIWVGA